MYKTAFISLLHGLSALFIFPFFSCPCFFVSAQSSMLNHARFSFSSLECTFGSCMCHESSLQSLSLFIQHSPFFFLFSPVFTHRNVSLRTHCRGEERDFPSLIYLFPSSLPLLDHFRLLLSLSLSLSSLLFSPHALPSTYICSLNLYWWFIGQLLQVHWNCKMRKVLLH